MAFLKRGNIKDGAICYARRRTEQQFCIRIEPCIRQIIDCYAGRSDNDVFPILKSEDTSEAYSQYLTAMVYYNRLLKRMSRMLGLQHGPSFYSARHSRVTLAHNANMPISVIGAGMGRTSERTTQIYLTSL